jgi:uncharacterized protein YbjT (DUF2867 family)
MKGEREVTEIGRVAVAGATGRLGRHVVEILEGGGHDVVPMSRKIGVDVITREGLPEALTGVKTVIDCATGPSPDEGAATEFFTTATRNLQEVGAAAGVERLIVVSIIGCDRFTAGYNVAKVAHERSALAGRVPARILRAAQFHEFVAQLLDWGTQNGVAYVPAMQTQLVAARTVAESLVELARTWDSRDQSDAIPEVAGPRVERLVEMARLVAHTRGGPERVEERSDPSDPDRELFATDGLLPGPQAILAGPTFEEWLAIKK